jgi:hypothetical protein
MFECEYVNVFYVMLLLVDEVYLAHQNECDHIDEQCL